MGRRMPNKIKIEVVVEFDERPEPEYVTVSLSGWHISAPISGVRYPVEATQELDRFLMKLRRANNSNNYFMTDEDMNDLIEAIHDTINDSGVEREDGAMVSTAEFSYYEPVKPSLRPEEQEVEQDCVATAKEGQTMEDIIPQAQADGQEFIQDALKWVPELGVYIETNGPDEQKRVEEAIAHAGEEDFDRAFIQRQLADLTPDPEKWALANQCTLNDAPEGLTDDAAAAYVREFNQSMDDMAYAMRRDMDANHKPGEIFWFRAEEMPAPALDAAVLDEQCGAAESKPQRKEPAQSQAQGQGWSR